MKKLELTKGKVALVDDEDFYWLSQFNWFAIQIGETWYAKRSKKKGILRNAVSYEIYLHRVVMQLHDKTKVVDHMNHNGLDCQKSNLRICSKTENDWHSRGLLNSSSIYKGVSWSKNKDKWQVSLKCEKEKIFIGYFDNEIEAAKAYDTIAAKYFGEFAHLNFKEDLVIESLEQIKERNKKPFVMTEEHKKASQEGLRKVDWLALRQDKCKKVVDINTGNIYNSLNEAALALNINKTTLSKYLLGKRTNKTNLKYI